MNKSVIVPILLCVVVCVGMAYFGRVFPSRDVKPGEVYIRSFDYDEMDNPFAEIETDTVYILDVKDGYVLLRVVDSRVTYTTSDKQFYMNRTRTLIKKIR